MNFEGQTFKTASFLEFKAATSELSKNPSLDIIVDNGLTLENYCFALLVKIFDLPPSQFSEFISYQTSLSSNPVCWLNKLENLLINNEDLFAVNKAMSRFNKLYNLIEKKLTDLEAAKLKDTNPKTPKRLINAESEDRHFSFYEVKKNIDCLENFKEQILFLTEEIFEYRQADIISLNNKLQDFDKQCENLIEKLQTMRKMRAELDKEQQEISATKTTTNKLKINCNVNQIVDVFYQLHRELFVDGKPIIDGNINDMASFIVNSFLDKDGKEISPETVKTILTPSRTDKRPKAHKKLDIDKML